VIQPTCPAKPLGSKNSQCVTDQAEFDEPGDLRQRDVLIA
jgi:hypothetical protein